MATLGRHLPHCLAKDPDWPADADEDDDMFCGLPAEHRSGHQWQLQTPSLEMSPGAHPISETGRQRLRQIPKPSRPLIRVHRYEYVMAVKWPELDHWLMIWPDEFARADPANPVRATTSAQPRRPSGGRWPTATPTSMTPTSGSIRRPGRIGT